jgi:hypothetical protein
MDIRSGVGMDQYLYYGFTLEQNVPNPAGDKTMIRYYIPEKGNTLFELRNIYGQLIYAEQAEPAAGSHEILLPLPELSSGVYFYTLEYNKQSITRRMIIER